MKPRFFKKPADLRKWLSANHKTKEELWVGYYKTSTGKPSITWPQSVDQALCFGWIDGIRKSIDEESYMIRFTPRRSRSIWSAVNLKNFEKLKAQGLIESPGQAAFDAKSAKNTNRYSFEQKAVALLPEYERQFRKRSGAWEFFQSLPPSVQKPSIWFVMSAKKEETQLRRLKILITSSSRRERIPQLVVGKKKN